MLNRIPSMTSNLLYFTGFRIKKEYWMIVSFLDSYICQGKDSHSQSFINLICYKWKLHALTMMQGSLSFFPWTNPLSVRSTKPVIKNKKQNKSMPSRFMYLLEKRKSKRIFRRQTRPSGSSLVCKYIYTNEHKTVEIKVS